MELLITNGVPCSRKAELRTLDLFEAQYIFIELLRPFEIGYGQTDMV